MTLIVRIAADPTLVAGLLRRLVTSVNADLPVSEVHTLQSCSHGGPAHRLAA